MSSPPKRSASAERFSEHVHQTIWAFGSDDEEEHARERTPAEAAEQRPSFMAQRRALQIEDGDHEAQAPPAPPAPPATADQDGIAQVAARADQQLLAGPGSLLPILPLAASLAVHPGEPSPAQSSPTRCTASSTGALTVSTGALTVHPAVPSPAQPSPRGSGSSSTGTLALHLAEPSPAKPSTGSQDVVVKKRSVMKATRMSVLKEEDERWERKRKAQRDASRLARGDMSGHVVDHHHYQQERETWRKRGEQNLVVFLNRLVENEKRSLQTAGYLGTEIRFWMGCTGNVTRKAVFDRLHVLVAGEAKQWRNGYYIGSTMQVLQRWVGWYDSEEEGHWVEGHRHHWTGKQARADMEVLAVSEGEAGPLLEKCAIQRYYARHDGCFNRRPDAAGTKVDAHNFLYFVWW